MARVNNKKLEEFIEKEIYRELLKEFKNINSVSDLDNFFGKFMTDDERTLFFRRIAVIKLLKQNKKYRDIKKLLGISSGTISKVADIIAGRGYSRNPDRKRKYSALSTPKKIKKNHGLRYKGAENILNLLG